MKLGIIIFIAVATIIGVAFVNNQPKAEVLSFATVSQTLDSGARLYDVRTPEEFTAGHFENAKLHPLQDIEAGIYPEAPKDTKLYVYCRSGNRSSQAKQLLEIAGFTNVTDLGGLTDVEKIGGKIVKE